MGGRPSSNPCPKAAARLCHGLTHLRGDCRQPSGGDGTCSSRRHAAFCVSPPASRRRRLARSPGGSRSGAASSRNKFGCDSGGFCPGLDGLPRLPNRRRSPGGASKAHSGVAGRRSRVLMTERRGQLAKTQNSMRAPSSTTRFGGMLKKSVAALALRAMKLNRRFRHRIIGAGPVGRSRALST
jgi:hypothetical protein